MIDVIVLGAGSALELYGASLLATNRRVLVCDTVAERALKAADDYNFQAVLPCIDAFPADATVLNLTPPGLHGRSTIDLLQRGHAVYSEKPAAHDRASLDRILQLMSQGARFAVAPDTHLSSAATKAKDVIASGELGAVLTVRGTYSTRGHELWHPRPFTFYGVGGGICLDIAPYFVRAVEVLVGPVSLQAVRRTLGSRPDLTPASMPAPVVPLRAEISLATCNGSPIHFALAYGTINSQSSLQFSFEDHDLIFDPVDSGSRLTLTKRSTGTMTILVCESDDCRGVGLDRFLAAEATDVFFGPDNGATLTREQHLLLAINHEDT